jgi:hypothetical protein
LQELKPKSLLKSFRFRILIIIFLVLSAAVLFYFWLKRPASVNSFTSNKINSENHQSNELEINYDLLKDRIDKNIDSILFTFNIKKEWINTLHLGDKPVRTKQEKTKSEPIKAQWFIKNVTIPKDLISTEVNLDLSCYLNSTGLRFIVHEDIKTADLEIFIYPPKDTMMNGPVLSKINIVHSEKVNRETGNCVLILNNIWEYKSAEIDDIMNSFTEFSFVFPRNLEQIDLQNKLIQLKKDVLVNLTIGEKDKPETDFSTGMEDKEIKQGVKSFITDFHYLKTVVLTRTNPAIPKEKIFSQITEELNKYNVTVIPDTMITKLSPNDEESKNKIGTLISLMKSKSINDRVFIGLVSLSYEELKTFCNEISTMKKSGYRFYSLSQYLSKQEQIKKKEMQKQDKQVKGDMNSANKIDKYGLKKKIK